MKTKAAAVALLFSLLISFSRAVEAQWVGPFGDFAYEGRFAPNSTFAANLLHFPLRRSYICGQRCAG